MTSHGPTRRGYLRSVGTVLAVTGLAGCSGTDAGGESTDATATISGGASTPATSASGTDDAATASDTPPTTEATATTTDPLHPGYEYDTTEVRAETPEGERLGAVTAAIADTPEKRFTGLSDTDSLPEDRGMLFVYDSAGAHTYVMRRMSFGIDIVYADDDGVITTVHHAPEPGPNEDGNEQEYPGRGQYVLEVNYEWTTRHGVEDGDVLDFEL